MYVTSKYIFLKTGGIGSKFYIRILGFNAFCKSGTELESIKTVFSKKSDIEFDSFVE